MPARPIERRDGDDLISAGPARVDVAAVHRYPSEESDRDGGRSLRTGRRAIEHGALIAGVHGHVDEQVGVGRMVTDLTTFAWFPDVHVLDDARRGGLGTALVRMLLEAPDVETEKWQFPVTRDVDEPYGRFGDIAPVAQRTRMHRRGPH